jgi:UPF0716 family protein affecting phage T7 exclusion
MKPGFITDIIGIVLFVIVLLRPWRIFFINKNI